VRPSSRFQGGDLSQQLKKPETASQTTVRKTSGGFLILIWKLDNLPNRSGVINLQFTDEITVDLYHKITSY